MMTSVSYTADGAVTISYATLISSPLSLGPSIEEAFGSHPESLGIVIVHDLPAVYTAYRERLLKLAFKFANLEESVREKYCDPKSRYSFGWSHGKELMNGRPDTLKGSFYANPITDYPTVPVEEQHAFPEYYGRNIWPARDEEGVGSFEDAFKDMGKFIFDAGCALAAACQPFALSHFSDLALSLPHLISTSQTTKARLLHYFPPSSTSQRTPLKDDPVDNWCGFHLDHSLLTGLCSALYLRHTDGQEPTIISSPSPKTGLYIQTRGGDLKKVSIPENCLAFQTGEALEIATGGKLLATPHCVKVVAGEDAGNISRETFALFMQPNTDQDLSDSMTFGDFSKKVFNEHYEER